MINIGVAIRASIDFAVMRYDSSGRLDTSFGVNGKVTTDFGFYSNSSEIGYAVIQQNDGKIVVAGQSNSNFALARYNSDGSLDVSFGGNGKITTDFDIYTNFTTYAYSVIQQSDNKTIVVGQSNSDFALARYNSDGSLDVSFGNPFIGADSNDTLVGNRDSNVIVGNGGDDSISGGGGNDSLTGGTGRDRFIFDIGSRYSQSIMGTSVITDFTRLEDKIVLDRSTFTQLKGNRLKQSDFASVKNKREASLSNSLFTYIRSSGTLFYNENRDAVGFGKGGKFADLPNGLNLSVKDFSVIA